jgi:TPR repeat protein
MNIDALIDAANQGKQAAVKEIYSVASTGKREAVDWILTKNITENGEARKALLKAAEKGCGKAVDWALSEANKHHDAKLALFTTAKKRKGGGTPRNKAIDFLVKLADEDINIRDMIYSLANEHKPEAIEWILNAASSKDETARNWIYSTVENAEKDYFMQVIEWAIDEEKEDDIKATQALIKAADKGSYLAMYHVGILYMEGKKVPRNLNKSQAYLKMAVLSNIKKEYRELAKNYLTSLEQAIVRSEEQERYRKELEDMMSMFAHKFRGPLDSIAYLEKDQRVLEDVRIMGGLLNIFSTISTSETQLRDKLRDDMYGDGTLEDVLKQALSIALATLLTLQYTERMNQHYYHYAQQRGLIDESVTWDEWVDEDLPHYELEEKLQVEWQTDFMNGLENAALADICAWVEARMFLLDIQGFDNPIRFKRYGATESTLLIIMQECLINALKYYAYQEKPAPLRLSWQLEGEYCVFRCSNPTSKREYRRSSSKGSGKGHQFLSLLARKLGSEFVKPDYADVFSTEFKIPVALLLPDAG